MLGNLLSLVHFCLLEALYCKIMQYIRKNIHLPSRVKIFLSWEEKGFPAHAKWCLQAIALNAIPKRWSDKKHCNYMHLSYSLIQVFIIMQSCGKESFSPESQYCIKYILSFSSSTRCLIFTGASILTDKITHLFVRREKAEERDTVLSYFSACSMPCHPPQPTRLITALLPHA